MPYEIEGNWKAGWALQLHTIASIMLNDGTFNNTYSDIGYALNRLKYHNDMQYFNRLVDEIVTFMNTRYVTKYISVIVPVPASKERPFQPVYAIAEHVAYRLGITYDPYYLQKTKNTAELKSITDPDIRCNILNGAFYVDQRYRNRKVLIIDDLYRSGSTLKELTKTMYNIGNVNDVYVVTLTKTRVHK